MSSTDDVYGVFEDLTKSTDPALAEICTALRTIITGLHAEAVEIVWKKQNIASYGVGPKKMTEHYVYIALHKKHVNLGFYHGAVLPDPEGLLTGTGKRLRHIKITDLATATSPTVAQLIRVAITEREEALA